MTRRRFYRQQPGDGLQGNQRVPGRLVKGCTVVTARYGGGGHSGGGGGTRRLGGRGGVEIMKRKASFTSLV